MTTHSIKIDPEFKAFIPPLKPEELAQLEQNILSDGCRDPLVVWMLPEFVTEDGDVFKLSEYSMREYQDGDENWERVRCWEGAEQDYFQEEWPCILIDGHNRFEICNRHSIEFNVVEMEFESRDEVLDWIDDNQLGKRNLTPDQTALLLGRKYNRAKKKQGGTGANQYEQRDQNDPSAKTADKIAAQHGVSPATVKRAGQFADAVERIEHAAPGFTESVLSGNNLSRQDVVKAAPIIQQIPGAASDILLAAEFSDLPHEAQQEAISEIAKSEPAQQVMRDAVKNYRAIGTGENEWYTPSEYVEMAREVMGSIDLDPASCAEANEVIKAACFYTKDDDGLAQTWSGNVWMNPPYSRDLMPSFIEKIKAEYLFGEVESAIIVSHNNTDTAWFHSLALTPAAICFPKKRIKFYRGDDVASPTNGQVFFYLGKNNEKFSEVFGEIGIVMELL